MNEQDIRRYAKLLHELDLTGLEVTENNRVVRLERTGVTRGQGPAFAEKEGYAVAGAQGSSPADALAPGAPAGAHAPSSSATAAASTGDVAVVTSPIVGVFYAAPAENADPYVSLGDSVQAGQVLCIIEAMKLMNEVAVEHAGVIEEICVKNGQVVEYGTPLFKVRR